jgi:hypothetical protein
MKLAECSAPPFIMISPTDFVAGCSSDFCDDLQWTSPSDAHLEKSACRVLPQIGNKLLTEYHSREDGELAILF